ncbi:MAG: hypothetical protein WCP30_00065 [Mycobacteriaceae bacterium]
MTSTEEVLNRRRPRGARYFIVLGLWIVGLVTAMGVLSVIDTRVVNTPVYVCPPDCGGPPTGIPVATNPRYVSPDGSFEVSYPAPGAAYTVSSDDAGVTAKWTAGDGGTLRLFGVPGAGRDARQVVEQVIAATFPDAVVDYELPNATVGYHPGYGVTADFLAEKRAQPVRVIVIAAVKNDLALVAVADGPFMQFGPGSGPGVPSPANLQIAQDMGKYVDSFSWRGDQPR